MRKSLCPGHPRHDFVQADSREDRDPVPINLTVRSNLVAATDQLLRQQQPCESVVGELGLLQVQPWEERRDPAA